MVQMIKGQTLHLHNFEKISNGDGKFRVIGVCIYTFNVFYFVRIEEVAIWKRLPPGIWEGSSEDTTKYITCFENVKKPVSHTLQTES